MKQHADGVYSPSNTHYIRLAENMAPPVFLIDLNYTEENTFDEQYFLMDSSLQGEYSILWKSESWKMVHCTSMRCWTVHNYFICHLFWVLSITSNISLQIFSSSMAPQEFFGVWRVWTERWLILILWIFGLETQQRKHEPRWPLTPYLFLLMSSE